MNSITLHQRAFLAGFFILLAYGVLISMMVNSPAIVLTADVISGLSVILIAILLYPLFSVSNPKLSMSYLLLKAIECGLMIFGGFLALFESTSSLREGIYNSIHLYVFIVSATILYILLYRSQILPRFIAIWGFVAISVLTLSTVLQIFQIKPEYLDYFLLLIITNEVFMAAWLMIKGFNSSRLENKNTQFNATQKYS